MTYAIRECFSTLQGEGYYAGRSAVFLRFSGCNYWSGRDEDRATAVGSCGLWCDTEFRGVGGENGGHYSAEELGELVASKWPVWTGPDAGRPYVVLTGGEPLLQVDAQLTDALHARGFEIGLETNGSLPVPSGVDWICVSPKAGARLIQRSGNELKFIFPQEGASPSDYLELEFDHFFVQPLDGPDRARNTALAVSYCLEHPLFRLSQQTHKLLGIP